MEPAPKVQVKPFKGVKTIDLEELDKSPSPPHVPLSPPKNV